MKINFSSLGELNPFTGPHLQVKVLNKYIGLIIGKNGETVRNLNQKTGCCIFIPKESKEGEDFRMLELSGSDESIKECKKEIETLVENANRVTEALYQTIDFNYLNKQGSQIISKNEVTGNIKDMSSLINSAITDINKNKSMINQHIPQSFTNPYAFNYHPINNLSSFARRLNMTGVQYNTGLYSQNNPNIYPYGLNSLNVNGYNLPSFQDALSVPVIQHMSINNYPNTTFVNFSNNLTQNHINIQPNQLIQNNNVNDIMERNLTSEDVRHERMDEKNLNISTQTQISSDNNKKKDMTSKKSTSGILNYIYGGHFK